MKSQSAMEYLMTYGWAILIIAIILVAFFELGLFNPYTYSPRASPGNCQVVRPNGPYTNNFVSLVGACRNEIPQSVAQFDGNNSVIETTHPVNCNGSVSVVAWVYYAYNQSTTMPPVLTSDNLQIYVYTYPLGNGLKFITRPASEVYYQVLSSALQRREWNFVAMTENNNTGEMDTYINSVRSPHVIANASCYQINQHLYFGRFGLTGGVWNGSISNLQIYNTSLTPNEVTALYNEGIGAKPINLQYLVGWWPLNGNAYDYSGNNNNGAPMAVNFTSNWLKGYSG